MRGIYYEPGSLKARLCREGIGAMYAFCEERGIAHERCGKVIVAPTEPASWSGSPSWSAAATPTGCPG